MKPQLPGSEFGDKPAKLASYVINQSKTAENAFLIPSADDISGVAKL
jgi:hypothetical protein